MNSNAVPIVLVIVIAASFLGCVFAEESDMKGVVTKLPKGQIELPAGYKHEQLQGFDSVPGRIVKEGGLRISYEIGGIPKPGAPRLGGQFTDAPKNMPKDRREWYKERTIAKQPVHMALGKDDRLYVAFPLSGINFSVEAKTKAEVDTALAILLTYRDPAIAGKK
jgi:hypothetical protein